MSFLLIGRCCSMRLGIFIPEICLTEKLSLLQKKYPEITLRIFPYSSIFTIPSLLYNTQKDFDALLFFGKTALAYTASRVTPSIPWEVIPRTNATFSLILFKALLNKNNIYTIATDLHPSEKQLLCNTYTEAGIDLYDMQIFTAPQFTFDESFVDNMITWYYACLKKNPDITYITMYSDVYYQLQSKNYPVIFCGSAYADICMSIEKVHSAFLLQASRESQLVIIYISIDEANIYSPLSNDEYQQILEMLTVAKYIHMFAQKIQGAVLPITEKDFLIFSTRSIVESQTNKFHNFSLVEDIDKNTASTISIGIGFGKTAMEAKKHAKIGVQKAQHCGGNQLYLVYDQHTIRGPFSKSSEKPLYISDRFISIAVKTGISAFTLASIHKIIAEQGKSEFTTAEIANLLNVSVRSINRTIVKLIDAGYCQEIGRKFQHKGGRPSRILSFKL